jgi:hypothetical protein
MFDGVVMGKRAYGIQLEDSKSTARGMRRFLTASGLAAAIAVAGTFLWIRSQSADPHSQVRRNQPLPPLMVASSGTAVDLRTFAAGARRVIVFYSPSCRRCQELLPSLRPFPSSLRLIMVNVSSDLNDPDISGLRPAALFHDRWHVLSRAFTAVSLPVLLFVDGGGVLRDGLVGRHERFFIQKKLKEFAIQ